MASPGLTRNCFEMHHHATVEEVEKDNYSCLQSAALTYCIYRPSLKSCCTSTNALPSSFFNSSSTCPTFRPLSLCRCLKRGAGWRGVVAVSILTPIITTQATSNIKAFQVAVLGSASDDAACIGAHRLLANPLPARARGARSSHSIRRALDIRRPHPDPHSDPPGPPLPSARGAALADRPSRIRRWREDAAVKALRIAALVRSARIVYDHCTGAALADRPDALRVPGLPGSGLRIIDRPEGHRWAPWRWLEPRGACNAASC